MYVARFSQDTFIKYVRTKKKFVSCQLCEPVSHFLRLKEHHGEVSHISERVSVHVPFPINNSLHIVLEKADIMYFLATIPTCMNWNDC